MQEPEEDGLSQFHRPTFHAFHTRATVAWSTASCTLGRVVLVLLLTVVPAGSVAAQADEPSMYAVPITGAVHSPGSLVPLKMQLTNPGDSPLTGMVRIESPGSSTRFERNVTVPPLASKGVLMLTAMPEVEARQVTLTPVWLSSDGQRLARTEVILVPDDQFGGDDTRGGGIMLTIIDPLAASESDAADGTELTSWLSENLGVPITTATISMDSVPPLSSTLQSVALIRIFGDPDQLDVVSREAVLDRVRAGAVLLIDAPSDAVNASFLARYLPAQVAGTRVATQAGSLQLTGEVTLSDLVPNDDAVIAIPGEDVVHAAWRPLGRGRVVLTSFPVSAVPSDNSVYQSLLGSPVDQAINPMQPSPEAREQVLTRMVGLQAPPWRAAAGIAGGYVLLLALALLLSPTVMWPLVYLGSGAVAVVLAVVLALSGGNRDNLSTAELRIIELSPGGNGSQDAWAVAFGADTTLTLRTDAPLAITAEQSEAQATVSMFPQSAVTPVKAASLPLVWHASGPYHVDADGQAILTLSDGPASFTLPDLPQLGKLQDAVLTGDIGVSQPLTPGDDGTLHPDSASQGLIAGDAALRAQVIEASNTGGLSTTAALLRGAQRLQVTAFAPDAPPALAPVESTVKESRTMTMVRLPVKLNPPAPGERVRVDGPLVRLVGGQQSLPKDASTGKWLSSAVPTSLVIGLKPDDLLAGFTTTSFTLDLDLRAPQHTFALMPARITDDGVSPIIAGRTFAEAQNPTSPLHIEVDATPDMLDKDGTVWITLNIQIDGAATGVSWQIRSIDAQLMGNFEGNTR